jgi:hypothetical protein
MYNRSMLAAAGSRETPTVTPSSIDIEPSGDVGMRVLVCGGREFANRQMLTAALNRLHLERGIGLIISGGARGADTMAEWWAKGIGVPCDVYEADWISLGPKAGPIRNQRMLEEGKPDLVMAFPGGRGTADMVRRGKEAGVEVIEVTYDAISPAYRSR